MTLIKEHLAFALELVNAAEQIIMPHYKNCQINIKTDGTEVTIADIQAEEIMRKLIDQQTPDYGVLGEEYGFKQEKNSKYKWVIDPIDGTTWFALGIPIFGTLVALLDRDYPVIGVMNFPALQETIFASRDNGCWIEAGGKVSQIKVTVVDKVQEAFVSAAGIHGSNIRLENGKTPFNLTDLFRVAKKVKFCGDCYQHALLCKGKINVAIDTIMSPWDSAAIIPCIEEAGGVATTMQGESKNIVFGGSLLTSSNQTLHSEAIRILRSGN